MNDELLDGANVPWDAISGPKPPGPVSAHRLPPTVFRDPVVSAAREANLAVLQRALTGSRRVVAGLFNRSDEEGNAA